MYFEVLNTLRGLKGLDTRYKRRAGDAKSHRCRVMAIEARHRVRNLFSRLDIWHFVEHIEPLEDIAVSEFLIGRVGRGMAVYTTSGLNDNILAFGKGLIVEHKAMASLFAKVNGKFIAVPPCF